MDNATPFELEHLGLTPTRYWALVDHLLGRPDVEAVMPVEVRRLRRMRDARRNARRRRVAPLLLPTSPD
jgi:hypothetical protein